MTRLLIIGHKFHYHTLGHLEGSQRPFYQALEDTFDQVTIRFIEDGWPRSIAEVPNYQGYDACMWFVLFRMLMDQRPFDWADYRGLRLLHDRDAHANFHNMLDPRYIGKWPEVFHRDKFQFLICTGKQTRTHW